jgi:hypothetical protein
MATPKPAPVETVLLPLELTPAAIEALEVLQEVLQTDDRLYRVVQSQLRQWQGRLDGPLTDTLAALVGKAD